MTELTSAQQRTLRAQAHQLHPVVSIAGNGLAPTVMSEIEQNLAVHALIKVRVYGADRHQRAAWMQEICDRTGAAAVQHIGNILVLWREKAQAAKAPETRKVIKPPARRPPRLAENKRRRAVPAQSRGYPARAPASRTTRTTRTAPRTKRR